MQLVYHIGPDGGLRPYVGFGSKVTVSATSDLCPKLEVNRTKSARNRTSTLTPHGSPTATGPRCHALGRIGGAQGPPGAISGRVSPECPRRRDRAPATPELPRGVKTAHDGDG